MTGECSEPNNHPADCRLHDAVGQQPGPDAGAPCAEARSFSDGHVFVYGSYDLPGDRFYCSREYHAFSASDLITWRHHGRSFSTQADAGTGAPLSEEWRNQTLFAPDCIFHNGRYHLFFCTASNGEGVARSAAPEGPFSDPQPVAGALGYATAKHPLGPFTKRGIIIDNAGCDPETWNNHGSRYSRGLCIEPAETDVLAQICTDDQACYRYFAFTGQTQFHVTSASATYGGAIEIRLDDPDGELIGTCTVRPTGSWSQLARSSCRITPAGCLTWVR